MNQSKLDLQPIPVYTINQRLSHPKPRPQLIQPVEYKLIPLTKNQISLVDNEDYASLSLYFWQARWSKITRTFYAQCAIPRAEGSQQHLSMHRMILGVTDPKILVDHIDRNQTLDNRRSNLRIATRSQNGWNSKISRNNRSGFKGIHFHARNNKWIAQITINRKHTYIGSFATKEEAFAAYRAAALQAYGEYACL